MHHFSQIPADGIGDEGMVCRCLAGPDGEIRHGLNRQIAKGIGVDLALQWSLPCNPREMDGIF